MQNKKQGHLLLMQIYIGFDLKWYTKNTTIQAPKIEGPFKFLSDALYQSQKASEWKIHGTMKPDGLHAYMICDAGHQQLAESMLTAELICILEANGRIANLLYETWDWDLLLIENINDSNMASIFLYQEVKNKFPEVFRMLNEHGWFPGTPGFIDFINEMQLYTLIKSTTDIDLHFNDDSVPEVFEFTPMRIGISTNFARCLREVNIAYKLYIKGSRP